MSAFRVLQSQFGYSREEILLQTENLVKKADKYGGVVFGGYVRDIIIPLKKLNRSLEYLDFKDLDFWFKSEECAELFINDAKLRKGPHDTKENPSGKYPVCRDQHMSQYKDRDFVVVDVMVTPFFPVCDFSVNLVSWDGESLNVHKPYNIISQVALDVLAVDKKQRSAIKTLTIDDFNSALKLHVGNKSNYTISDLRCCIDILRSLNGQELHDDPLSDSELAEYQQLTKQQDFTKQYTLDEIVKQIGCNVYDTCGAFLWMSQNGRKYRKFNTIPQFASVRIGQFKTRRLGGCVTHGTF